MLHNSTHVLEVAVAASQREKLQHTCNAVQHDRFHSQKWRVRKWQIQISGTNTRNQSKQSETLLISPAPVRKKHEFVKSDSNQTKRRDYNSKYDRNTGTHFEPKVRLRDAFNFSSKGNSRFTEYSRRRACRQSKSKFCGLFSTVENANKRKLKDLHNLQNTGLFVHLSVLIRICNSYTYCFDLTRLHSIAESWVSYAE